MKTAIYTTLSETVLTLYFTNLKETLKSVLMLFMLWAIGVCFGMLGAMLLTYGIS